MKVVILNSSETSIRSMAERGWEGSAESLNYCWNMINPSKSVYEAQEPTYLQWGVISCLLFLSFDFWPVPLEMCVSTALLISFYYKRWKTMLPFSLLFSKVFLLFMLEARADLFYSYTSPLRAVEGKWCISPSSCLPFHPASHFSSPCSLTFLFT